jgi:hypothetical protein
VLRFQGLMSVHDDVYSRDKTLILVLSPVDVKFSGTYPQSSQLHREVQLIYFSKTFIGLGT